MTADEAVRIWFVLVNIDDILTRDGKLPASSYTAL
jgi:hypothetical protein